MLKPLLTIALLLSASAHAQPSALWGKDGEKWSPTGRLPDFSFAGYHRGEAALPNVPVAANVRDFGAKGDGQHDDSHAFKDAIEKTPKGAIEIPPGRYLITQILDIKKPDIVLRGAGPAKTTLYFTKNLQELRPNMGATTSGRPTSNYSWSGGFLWLRGSFGKQELTPISGGAKRGEFRFTVAKPQALKVGQTVEIHQRDTTDNSFCELLYAADAGNTAKIHNNTRAQLTARITHIDQNSITIDRPLRFDLDPRWQPRLLRFAPTVKEVGIEGLRFEFPPIPYGGHFTELGHNAIAFTEVADCWVRDVQIDHSDSGIFCSGRFNTFTGIVFKSERPVDKGLKCTGHHGVDISGGDDNLFTRFDFQTRFVHDITVSASAAGNVFSDGTGVDLCLDHHKRTPHANLFTALDAGAGTRLWRCGGGDALGKHAAAYSTFWNIKAQRPQTWPPDNFGPDLMNLVGLQTTQPTLTAPTGKWFEAITVTPANLHQAQLNRRLARPTPRAQVQTLKPQ